jgi:hypothetical protein
MKTLNKQDKEEDIAKDIDDSIQEEKQDNYRKNARVSFNEVILQKLISKKTDEN